MTDPYFDFKKSSSQATGIRFSVFLAHILCLLPILLGGERFEKPKKILVKTVSLQESRSFEPIDFDSETFIATAFEVPEAIDEPPELLVKEEAIEITPPIHEEDTTVAALHSTPPEDTIEPLPEPKKEAKPAPKPKQQPTKKNPPPPKPQQKPAPKAKPLPKAKPAPTPKAKPQPKKEVKTKSTKPAPQPKKKPAQTTPTKKPVQPQESAAEKKERQRELALVNDALSCLDRSEKQAKASSSSQKKQLPGPAPSKIAALQSEATVSVGIADDGAHYSPRERSYYDELVSRLKLALKLPEYGEVKIKLTLSRQGRVTKVVVTQAKSRKNKEYIEKMLVVTNFPRFGDNFGKEAEHTFQLNLSNELHY